MSSEVKALNFNDVNCTLPTNGVKFVGRCFSIASDSKNSGSSASFDATLSINAPTYLLSVIAWLVYHTSIVNDVRTKVGTPTQAVPVPLWPLYASNKFVGDDTSASQWITLSPWQQWVCAAIVANRGITITLPRHESCARAL